MKAAFEWKAVSCCPSMTLASDGHLYLAVLSRAKVPGIGGMGIWERGTLHHECKVQWKCLKHNEGDAADFSPASEWSCKWLGM